MLYRGADQQAEVRPGAGEVSLRLSAVYCADVELPPELLEQICARLPRGSSSLSTTCSSPPCRKHDS